MYSKNYKNITFGIRKLKITFLQCKLCRYYNISSNPLIRGSTTAGSFFLDVIRISDEKLPTKNEAVGTFIAASKPVTCNLK